MTPTVIFALIRDALILFALGFVAWKVYRAGESAVTRRDQEHVIAELQQQQRNVEAYRQQVENANAQRIQDLSEISSRIDAQHQPVLVLRNASSPRSVSCPTTATPGSPPIGGTADGRSGGDSVDIRPAINQFETRYENIIAGCRAALASWPK